MSDQETRVVSEELQFDRVVPEATPATAPGPPAVVCTTCHATIGTMYYHINGNPFCGRCRATVEAIAETPRGLGPLLMAGLFGLGAGIAGAAIYYAVIAITNFEIGIVAILIGYMVGYSVRKSTQGRGGRRFQVLAAVLTYASVALAYMPIAVRQVMAADRTAHQAPASTESSVLTAEPATGQRAARERPTTGQFLFAVSTVVGLVLALPVLVVVASFPSGLISAFIIFIGMRQAWRMTGAPTFEVLGPYRVGAAPAPTSP